MAWDLGPRAQETDKAKKNPEIAGIPLLGHHYRVTDAWNFPLSLLNKQLDTSRSFQFWFLAQWEIRIMFLKKGRRYRARHGFSQSTSSSSVVCTCVHLHAHGSASGGMCMELCNHVENRKLRQPRHIGSLHNTPGATLHRRETLH